ncbi:hypothetical protein CLLU_31480 [Clostridium luticellarii]|jgi:hypothetical protein|uniref:Uncharacterized protein n=1 Tax=Clostridium luticellarii TaxID=1691940 RepID=A0A2T0BBU5_9CLOT|nr:hypothetical protein CLLU_31480 [Clostridium luticellarii]
MKEQLSPIELRNRHVKTAIITFFIMLILAVSATIFLISSI